MALVKILSRTGWIGKTFFCSERVDRIGGMGRIGQNFCRFMRYWSKFLFCWSEKDLAKLLMEYVGLLKLSSEFWWNLSEFFQEPAWLDCIFLWEYAQLVQISAGAKRSGQNVFVPQEWTELEEWEWAGSVKMSVGFAVLVKISVLVGST